MKVYKIIDGSYSVYITKDGALGENFRYEGKTFIKITSGIFPTPPPFVERHCAGFSYNNIMLQCREDEGIVFTSYNFIKEITICPHCGKELACE
jgi:hypothetical protein